MKRILFGSLAALVLMAGCSAPAEEDAGADGNESASLEQSAPAEESGSVVSSDWKTGYDSMGNAVVGEPAPSIEIEDENGETWKLADYAGSVVVLDFWALW